MTKLIICAFMATVLTGCSAGFKSDFSCDKVGGVGGCVTMNEVRDNLALYEQANRGNSTSNTATTITDPNNPFILLPRRNRDGEPERTREIKRKVTIFPFLTDNKTYIDTTDIYIVIEDSQWTGRPVQSIKKD